MAHEKLSPRQKMIGMMYLVLTAMLALNVQKEVVKAFMKVDKGLTQTVNNYVQKNNLTYEEFERSFAQFPEKTKEYRTKALAVKERADELYDYIQGLKIQMIIEADGPDAPAINKSNNEVDIELVDKYDENNIPSAQLVGDNEDGKGYELMDIISKYKDFLIETIEGKAPSIVESLKKTLSTEKGVGEDKQLEPWPNHTFQLMPLVGASALLTKIQVDVRNAETEVINFLYSQITKADIKVNKLKAVVIPKSTYVTIGSNYEASIFLSALDTTNRPVIKVGETQLDLDDLGRGTYISRASYPVGSRKYNGIVSINTAEGTSDYEFDAEYSVGEPNVVISPTAMKKMYKGLDNPIDISVPGYGPDKIKISKVIGGTYSQGRVKNAKGEYFQGNWLIKPTGNPGTPVQIWVTAQDPDGKLNPYGPVDFVIKKLPDPTARFAGKSTGTVTHGEAIMQDRIVASLGEDFDFEAKYTVTGFTVAYADRMGDRIKISNNNLLTSEQREVVNAVTRGRDLIIKNIKAIGPDNIPRDIPSITLTIN